MFSPCHPHSKKIIKGGTREERKSDRQAGVRTENEPGEFQKEIHWET